MTDDGIRLRDVARLVLGPGETLVATVPDGLSDEVITLIRETIKRYFPDNRVLVVTEGISLSVVKETGQNRNSG